MKFWSVSLFILFFSGLVRAEISERQRQELHNFMKKENIIAVTRIQDQNLGKFILSYLKIPQSVREYMHDHGATIHILEGKGVKEDPSWESSHMITIDKRSWDYVPGSGGYPYAGKQYPTRVVVNRLNDGSHGSGDLTLHEYGHALDSAERLQRFSRSKRWNEILRSESGQKYLKEICSGYCANSASEAFAESFARYYESEKSRRDLLDKAPGIFAYITELTTLYVSYPDIPF